jgi:hypothetical protein
MDDVRNHEVEQIQGIIQGKIFEAMGKGQEGGEPPRRTGLTHGGGSGEDARAGGH